MAGVGLLQMVDGRMTTRAALMAVLFAVLCASSTARRAILTHRMLTRYIPSGFVSTTTDEPPSSHPDYDWKNGREKLFDRKTDKRWTGESREGSNFVFVEYQFPKKTKVTKYRIYVPTAGDPEKNPRTWTLYGTKTPDRYSTDGLVELHRMENYEFIDKATPTLKLTKRGKFRKYYLKITEDGNPSDGKVHVAMTEIKLIGNLSQFDDPEFPAGIYPCKRTLDMLTTDNALDVGTPFSTKPYSSTYKAREAFDHPGNAFISAVNPDPPVILGYEFDSATTVNMYRVVYTNGNLTERALKKFEFQGSFCSGGCDSLGENGWVTLDTVTGHKWDQSPSAWDGRDQFVVSDPKPYKAYRLRITKDNYNRVSDITAAQVGHLVLMGCTL